MLYQWGRKDAFPGADGSTITEESFNATTIPIYGATNNVLDEGAPEGLQFVPIETSDILTGTNAQMYSIKNPMSFICNANPLKDWYTNNEAYVNNTLWQNEYAQKSLYDPCPNGWKVPPAAAQTYGDFSTATMLASELEYTVYYGRIYQQMAWFPAIGCRYYDTGKLSGPGRSGSAWSSAINTINDCDLFFNVAGVHPTISGGRANGISVRCVQE